MAIDLTGANFSSYILRIVRDVVSRLPRFRSALGNTSIATANQVSFGDVAIVLKNVSASGTRLSPDYFIRTQLGRALVAKIQNKDSMFIEWLVETDASGASMDPGVYYIEVTSVDEQTQQVQYTVDKFQWKNGSVSSATGSIIYFNSAINTENVQIKDSSYPNNAISTVVSGGQIAITSPVNVLSVLNNGTPLTPLTDYWAVQSTSTEIVHSTLGGKQTVTVDLSPYLSYSIQDGTGYTLRPGVDYTVIGGSISLSSWTPTGATLTLVGMEKVDPTHSAINAENIIPITLGEGQSLATGQVVASTSAGTFTSLTLLDDGSYCLPTLLLPGQSMWYDLRVSCGQYTTFGQKNHLTRLLEYTQSGSDWTPTLSNNQPVDLIPGVYLAVGDNFIVGDQAAVIVSPFVTETYHVYGSKDNISFTLDIRANDYVTASDIAESLKHALLVTMRDAMETDGVSIFEATRDNTGAQRDNSGTALTYTFSLNFSAACDWKVFVPLVTRIADFEMSLSASNSSRFPGIQITPVLKSYGVTQQLNFVPEYM